MRGGVGESMGGMGYPSQTRFTFSIFYDLSPTSASNESYSNMLGCL